ncbi:hypothetical protein BSKO_12818 [Bryopsis sp. KO-2023]|nr:hypothetical protein BSKO_12818 [Bryopsis sp. KO-2023]
MCVGLAGPGTSGFVSCPRRGGVFRKETSTLKRSYGRDVCCSRSDARLGKKLKGERDMERTAVVDRDASLAQPCSSAAMDGMLPSSCYDLVHRLKSVVGSSWKTVDSVLRKLFRASPAFQCMAFAMPSLPGGGWADLWKNRIFVAGLLAWFLAQFGKIFTKRFTKGVWDLMAFRDSGGMPSSHSAMSMAVTTAIALDVGMQSPMFTVALCFTSIVMYDAAGVRKHAGYQAQVLNSLVEHAGLPDTHPFSARKLKEVLGHTPRQVIVGGLLGIVVGMFAPCAS